MLRGEFICGNGLVIPNNVTKFGAAAILNAALRNVETPFWAGLVDGVPTSELQIQHLLEPTLGIGGYSRKQIARSASGWPGSGNINGEPYLESDWLVWAAVGVNFDKAIRRVMITTSNIALTGDVFALSSPLPELLTVTPTMAETNRRFKYRLYLR